MLHANTKSANKGILLWVALALSAIIASMGLVACDSEQRGSGAATATPRLNLSRAEMIFNNNCNVCHPGGNRGAGPSLIELVPNFSDDQIKATIRRGKQRMPAYNTNVISDPDLDALVTYIRTLK